MERLKRGGGGGPTLPVETVEQWFERLALGSQGRTGALDGLPPGREAAAALLVLREFMHHDVTRPSPLQNLFPHF